MKGTRHSEEQASAQMRPKPREAPVMNHVFCMWIPHVCNVK
jgi:hypothetical protein